MADFDNSGALDIAVVNGRVRHSQNSLPGTSPPQTRLCAGIRMSGGASPAETYTMMGEWIWW